MRSSSSEKLQSASYQVEIFDYSIQLFGFVSDVFLELFLNREDARGLIGLKLKGLHRA